MRALQLATQVQQDLVSKPPQTKSQPSSSASSSLSSFSSASPHVRKHNHIASTHHVTIPTLERRRLLLLARVQLTIGQWLATMKMERSDVIASEYLVASTAIFEQLHPSPQVGREAAKAYVTVANYMFDNYHQAKTRIESREWRQGKQVTQAQEEELRLCQMLPPHERNRYLKHIVPLQKQVLWSVYIYISIY